MHCRVESGFGPIAWASSKKIKSPASKSLPAFRNLPTESDSSIQNWKQNSFLCIFSCWLEQKLTFSSQPEHLKYKSKVHYFRGVEKIMSDLLFTLINQSFRPSLKQNIKLGLSQFYAHFMHNFISFWDWFEPYITTMSLFLGNSGLILGPILILLIQFKPILS